MGFEHLPAAVGAEIYIVDINSTARSQHTKRLDDIVISVPRFEMHEDDRAINNIHGSIRNASQVIAGYLLQLHVRQIL